MPKQSILIVDMIRLGKETAENKVFELLDMIRLGKEPALTCRTYGGVAGISVKGAGDNNESRADFCKNLDICSIHGVSWRLCSNREGDRQYE